MISIKEQLIIITMFPRWLIIMINKKWKLKMKKNMKMKLKMKKCLKILRIHNIGGIYTLNSN